MENNKKLPPSCIKEQFSVKFSNAINSVNCRLTIPYFRTELGKKTLLYQGFKLWNRGFYSNKKSKHSQELD